MQNVKNKHIAIIGAGNIGRMLLDRLAGLGVPGELMAVCDADPERAETAAAAMGARIFDLLNPVAGRTSLWLLCPGPQAVLPVLIILAPFLQPGSIVVSFAAAIGLDRLEALVPEGVSVARVMPNMPSQVGLGMNPVCFSRKATTTARAVVMEILDALGDTIEVPDEQMNWFVGLSGAAMRSLLPAMEGMIRAGLEAGLPEADARLVAARVVMGTAGLVQQTGLPIAEIKALTPMETLDEPLVERLFYESVVGAKVKIDRLQQKITLEKK